MFSWACLHKMRLITAQSLPGTQNILVPCVKELHTEEKVQNMVIQDAENLDERMCSKENMTKPYTPVNQYIF